MKFVGVDLHKHTIKLCVIRTVRSKRKIIARRKFQCCDEAGILAFFEKQGRFQVVVEATAAYEWFFRLIERLADRLVLAHPRKLRVIAESTRKTDKIDAEVLATFLALDMIPEAYRPTPRIRNHRVLTRLRCWLSRRITANKTKLRNKLAQYNADIADLFSQHGRDYMSQVKVSDCDRFEMNMLLDQLQIFERELKEADTELAKFAKKAPVREREAREILSSIPQVGPVTLNVVLSELGDWRRFRNTAAVVDFAGLAPGIRESAGKAHSLSITKEGSRILRWALIEAAWRLVGKSARWDRKYQKLHKNTGSEKKAIVGIARQLLVVMYSILCSGQTYRAAA